MPFKISTAGHDNIRGFHVLSSLIFTCQILNMLKLKRDVNQQDLATILLNLNNSSHSLKNVDRVSETQLQVSENSN